MSLSTLHLAASLLYLVATVLSLLSLIRTGDRKIEQAHLGLLGGAFLIHTLFLGQWIGETSRIPLNDLYELLIVFSWILVLFFFTVIVVTRISVLSFFLTPMAFLLVGWAYLRGHTVATPQGPESYATLFWSHILFAVLGLVGLVVGVAFAWMYQLQVRALKSKSRNKITQLIPSLERCDKWGHRSLATGFILYTFGILHAALWSYKTKGTYAALNAKEFGSILVWTIFAVLLQARLTWGPRGRIQALLGTAGMIAILITLAGVR